LALGEWQEALERKTDSVSRAEDITRVALVVARSTLSEGVDSVQVSRAIVSTRETEGQSHFQLKL
jgi:hypothetical protein